MSVIEVDPMRSRVKWSMNIAEPVAGSSRHPRGPVGVAPDTLMLLHTISAIATVYLLNDSLMLPSTNKFPILLVIRYIISKEI